MSNVGSYKVGLLGGVMRTSVGFVHLIYSVWHMDMIVANMGTMLSGY